MHKLLTILLLLISLTSGLSQELPAAYRAYIERFPEGPALNHLDSIIPDEYPGKNHACSPPC